MRKMCRIGLAAGVLLGAASGAFAQNSGHPPQVAAARIHFDIPAGSLGEALQELGRQSGLTIITESSIADHLNAPRLDGTYTPAEALARMLGHIGLRFQYLDSRTIAILAQGAAPDPNEVKTQWHPDDAQAGDASSAPEEAAPRTPLRLAQAPAAVPAPEAAGVQGLQEVVVTAQFRNESAQQAPLAITAINAQMLIDRGQTGLAQVAADVPSLTLLPAAAAFGPSMTAAIRGIGQTDFNPALEPGVGIYVDDVYYASLTGSMMDLLDLDRVEILRGPQGTLEGMNSEGGAVKLFSKRPDAITATTFDALYGSLNHVEIRGSTNFTLIPDTLFIRLAGVGNHQDGYENVFDFGCANPSFTATASNGVTGTYSVAPTFTTTVGNCRTEQQGGTGYAAGRASIRWVINDNLEAIFIGDLTNEDQENPATSLLYAGPGPYGLSAGVENLTIPTTSGALLQYDSAKVPAMIPSNRYAVYTTDCLPAINNPNVPAALGGPINTPAYCVPDRQTLTGWGGSATVNWTLNDHLSLKNILAERGFSSFWGQDATASPWPVGLGANWLGHHQFSEELRLNGQWGSLLDYTLGGFYFREFTTYNTHQDLWYATDKSFVGAQNFLGGNPVLAHDKAAYLHTVWHVSPKLDVTTGLRSTSQDKADTYIRTNPQGGTGGTATLVSSLNGVVGHYSAHRWDYRGDVDYHFTDRLMGYAQVSTGFKGGGVNPRPFFASQVQHFEPETLTNYELGFKTSWLDNRLRVNLDGYFSQYRNIQETLLNCGFIPSIAALGQGAPCALPYNAGSAHVKGLELETQGRFGGFQFDASGSYLDFQYVSLLSQLTSTSLAPGTRMGLGMVTPYTPSWQANVGAQYTLPIGSAGALTGRVDANGRGSVYTNAVNTATNRIGGYALYNAHLTWTTTDGSWQVILQGLNLTNKFYWVNIFDLTAAGSGTVSGTPSPPREVDIEIKHSL
jgi:iron complex outermembrane recepter protein